MIEVKDYLPAKYLDSLEKRDEVESQVSSVVRDLGQRSLVKRNKSRLVFSLFLLAIFFIGLFSALALLYSNQDNRQQASSTCDPASPHYDPSCLTPTATPANSNTDRPKTEAACASQGFWINNLCYLFWETLPGGTHMVVPPAASGRTYSTLMPTSQALLLQGSTPSTSTPTSAPSISLAPSSTVVYDFSINGRCDSPFYMTGGKCVPNQRDPAWDSRWINATGCGAMQTLYYALKKDPNLDVNAFLREHYDSYLKANVSANTYTVSNLDILRDLGYNTEPYRGVIAYHGEKLTEDGSTIFIGALFDDINHFASISQVTNNDDGTTTLNMVDSYFKADKCVSMIGEPNTYRCYNDKGEKVASLNMENASVYVVSNNEI